MNLNKIRLMYHKFNLKYMGLVYRTVKHLKWSQIFHRFRFYIRNAMFRTVKSPKNKLKVTLLPLNYSVDIDRAISMIPAKDILDYKFHLVSNEITSFNYKVDWDMMGNAYRLKCFRLNSFRWLLDLSDAYHMTSYFDYLFAGFYLIDDWNRFNRDRIIGDKWNAYVVAERIMNWIGFCSQNCEMIFKRVDKYAEYIYEQAMELYGSVEFYLLGNHLLSEAKALLFAGIFLNEDKFYKYGKKILFDEIDEQFMNDGGHFERSVSYHVESMQQYFESIAGMQLVNDSDALVLIEKLIPAYQYLNEMIDAYGNIPLFNDSAYDYPVGVDASDFLGTAELLYNCTPPRCLKGQYFKRWFFVKGIQREISWEEKCLYEDTGYLCRRFEVSNVTHSIYVDVSDGGPEYNLGHMHADALNILFASEQKEIFVDTGVFTYEDGNDRIYCRSTEAHNTIEIDGINNAEIWASFRVGARGKTTIVNYLHNDGAGSRDRSFVITAMHDGYKEMRREMEDTRVVYFSDTEKKIWIYYRLEGKGNHKIVSRFHLNPLCRIDVVDDYTILIDENIVFHSSQPAEVEDCKVAANFGVKRDARRFVIRANYPEVKTLTVQISFTRDYQNYSQDISGLFRWRPLRPIM